MKFLLLLLISFSAMASYLPESKIGQDTTGMKIYSKQKKCQEIYSENCVSIRGKGNMSYHKIADEMIEDRDAPAWGTRSMVGACSGEQDCKDKALALVCADERISYYNEEYSEVWCNKILGYGTKKSGKKIIVEDEALKVAHDNQEAAKNALEAGVQQALTRINSGKRIIALLLVRNASKSLSKGQIKQMNSTYAEIKGLLDTGSLETAKDEIAAITPDGTIVTTGDQAALIAEIDRLLGN